MQQSVEELTEEFKDNLDMQKEYMEPNPDILEKQEKLEKMFEEVVPDEMKKLMEELEKLMEKLNKEQSLEEMEKCKWTTNRLRMS